MAYTLLAVAVEILAEQDRVREDGGAREGFTAVVMRMLPVILGGDTRNDAAFGARRLSVINRMGQVGPVFEVSPADADGFPLAGGRRLVAKAIENSGIGGPCKITFEVFDESARVVGRGVVRGGRPSEALTALKDDVLRILSGLPSPTLRTPEAGLLPRDSHPPECGEPLQLGLPGMR